MSDINTLLESYGLVDLQKLDQTIVVDLKYSTTDNFIGKVLYADDLKRAYCEAKTADTIVKASQYLSQLRPGYHFVIWDAARPISVQRTMFDTVAGTNDEQYIANPYGDFVGGFHNYGLAVDLTIADENGVLLEMGTGFDSFRQAAHSFAERQLVIEGVISAEAYANRLLLYHVTGRFGLLPHPNEWWHYQLVNSEEEKVNYPLLDF